MARFGRQVVIIPSGVQVKVEGGLLKISGAKGNLEKKLPRGIGVEITENEAKITTGNLSDKKLLEALKGTMRAHLANMVHGVSEGWSKSLEIVGAGYRASVSGNTLSLMIGYSHPVEMEIPEGLGVTIEKNVVNISGADKEVVGQFSANVRSKRVPEPYKGSGIKYTDEIIRRKAGKQAAKAGAA